MPVIASDTRPDQWLLCRADARLCAVPLRSVIEVMRLLPIEPLAGSPPFVLGLCIHRGAPIPVIDAGRLFGPRGGDLRRLVAVRAGHRVIGMAFAAVIGLRTIGTVAAAALPPLVREAAGDVLTAIATLDAELLHVLDAAKAAPESLLDGLAAEGTPL